MASKKRRNSKAKKESTVQIYGGILFVLSLIVLLHENTGFLGEFLHKCSRFAFGNLYFIFYFILIIAGLSLFIGKELPRIGIKKLVGGIVLLLGIILLTSLIGQDLTGKEAMDAFFARSSEIYNEVDNAGGGVIGILLYALVSGLISKIGTIILTVVLFVFGIYMLLEDDFLISAYNAVKKYIADNKNKPKPVKKQTPVIAKKQKPINVEDTIVTKEPVYVPEPEPEIEPVTVEPVRPAVKEVSEPVTVNEKKTELTEKQTNSVGFSQFKDYRLPRLSLLENSPTGKGNENRNNAKIKGQQLIEILEQFDVPCTLQETHIGPSVTKFEVKPQPGIKVSKITSLQENIKMELAVKDVRIEAPVPGKNAVGIEIPNIERSGVKMKELLSNVPDKYSDRKLTIALGKDLAGENVYAEIDRMPHLLIAGSTGSGKSVCINSIITTLLLRTTPNDVKLLLIDPKKVEFTPYTDIPNLIGPVITDTSEAANALKIIVSIMDNRYNKFHDVGVRDIKEYNKKAKTDSTLKPMVQIVVIIDELADLMITHGKDVEASIQRITQLARASGIHLIVATQRPSTDVITGTIKTNIPSRIAFAVASAIDSRIVLDQVGAERLLGNGDMLYIPMGESAPQRIQGVYVSDEEIRKITDFVKSQGKPEYDDAFVVGEGADTQMMGQTSADPLYEDVKKFVATTGKASTSSIQRYFGFGYNRAARIIDFLEQEGAIGPANGSKPREVFITADDFK